METRIHGLSKVIVALGVGGMLMLAGCGGDDDAATKATPITPLDPTTEHYGKTYAEWGSAWWRWYYGIEMPADGTCLDPTVDATGEHCGYGQDPQSPVFFLVGNRGGTQVRTKCVIPKGKAVFFPILNYNDDNGGIPVAQQQTLDEMKEGAQAGSDSIELASLLLEIDGQTVTDLGKYKVNSTQYSYTVPAIPNVYSCAGTPFSGEVDPAFHGGYYVLLPDLSPGQHTIRFGGAANQQQPPFVLDMTQIVTVQ